jgi:hypothetical protein
LWKGKPFDKAVLRKNVLAEEFLSNEANRQLCASPQNVTSTLLPGLSSREYDFTVFMVPSLWQKGITFSVRLLSIA